MSYSSTKDARPDELWKKLGADSAAIAFPAMVALAGRPAEAIELVRKNLKPAAAKKLDPNEMRTLLVGLGAEKFNDRELATKAIEAFGPAVIPHLKAALPTTMNPEVSRRITNLLIRLDRAGPTPDMIRPTRAVELLEWIGTADAKTLLKELAGGSTGHFLTEQAKAALVRLGEKP